MQTGYPKVPCTPKRGFFGKFDLVMETFLEYETICREPSRGHVFVESLAEIDPRKVAKVVRDFITSQKNASACDPFFRALSETHSAISLKTCKA